MRASTRGQPVEERRRADPPDQHGQHRDAGEDPRPPEPRPPHAATSLSTWPTHATVRSQPAQPGAPGPGGVAQPRAERGVGEPLPQRGGEGGRVVRRHEEPRPGPVRQPADGLRHRPGRGGDDRQPVGQRLGEDHAVALRAAGVHQHVRGGVRRLQVRPGPGPGEPDPVREPEVARPVPEQPRVPGVAVHAADAVARPRQVSHPGERRQQHGVPLGRREGSHAEQPGAGLRAGGGRDGLGTGLGDVHAVAGHRAARQQLPPRPAAGGDHRPGGAERRGLPDPAGGMCSRSTSRSRPAWGTTSSGAAPTTSPSTSTVAPSGRPASRAASAPRVGGTGCSCTVQPAASSPRHSRRS